jgi:oxysterol-binding protein 1
MKNARVKTSTTDKLRFEVHASTRNGEGIPEKWYMKANHAVEVARWVKTLQRSIDWSKRSQGRDSDVSSVISVTTDAGTSRSGHSARKRFSRATSKAVFGGIKKTKDAKSGSPAPSLHEPLPASLPTGHLSSDEDSPYSKNTGSEEQLPHQESFELLGNTAATHLDLTLQLLSDFNTSTSSDAEETLTSLKASLSQAQLMFGEYVEMVNEREAWFRARIRREHEKAGIWEESLQKVVQEGEELEEELKKTLRLNKEHRRRSKVFNEPDADATLQQRTKSLTFMTNESPVAPALAPVEENVPSIMVSAEVPEARTGKAVEALVNQGLSPQAFVRPPEGSVASDSDSDEFFDAIEANALPNMVIPESLQSETNAVAGVSWINTANFEGYLHPRQHLGLSADNRPPVSLWAVLKGSIGKDLTKISFPVFFSASGLYHSVRSWLFLDEPTSMLQRMAEDMEFSGSLDAAVNEQDPLKRIAYVAAFAMSNYSSTIGRIAKPFNPMLV